MNQPVILFRKGYDEENEFDEAKEYFKVVESRSECKDQLVIGRYSVLPFYHELWKDLTYNGCNLANTTNQHLWIANFEYYYAFKDYTPESWDEHDWYRCIDPGPFVIKGKTNSFKHSWDSMMYAPDRTAAAQIACTLMKHDAIRDQGIVYRKFVPLKTYEKGYNDVPITNEWRFFYWGEERLCHGYYWGNIASEGITGEMTTEGLAFADKMASIASEYAQFFVIDIAEKADGGWILIEINDGQMSGLSDCKPDELYWNLMKVLSK